MGTTDKPIALVVGAGDHLGSAIARRFAREGFHLVVTPRRGDLEKLSREISDIGSTATAIHSDARDETQVTELINAGFDPEQVADTGITCPVSLVI
jgi:NADP-dependent 3-hydroxy acid dehydrogenase YdfG